DVQRLGASGNNCVERPGIASVCRHEIWSKAPAHWVRSKCGSDDMTGIAGIYRDHRFAVLVGLEAKRPGNHVDDQDSGCRSAARLLALASLGLGSARTIFCTHAFGFGSSFQAHDHPLGNGTVSAMVDYQSLIFGRVYGRSGFSLIVGLLEISSAQAGIGIFRIEARCHRAMTGVSANSVRFQREDALLSNLKFRC